MTHATAMYQTILNAVAQASDGHSFRQNSAGECLRLRWHCQHMDRGDGHVGGGNQRRNRVQHESRRHLPTARCSTMSQISCWQKAVVIFAAAGNQPVNTPTFPAAIPGVNDVTALGQPGSSPRMPISRRRWTWRCPAPASFPTAGKPLLCRGPRRRRPTPRAWRWERRESELRILVANPKRHAAEVSGAEAINFFDANFARMPRIRFRSETP